MKITARQVVNCFVDGDHFRIGLDKGYDRIRLSKILGLPEATIGTVNGYKQLCRFSAAIQGAKRLLDRDGFTLDSMKFRGKPVVYFIVEPGSEERANHHNKLVKRAVGANYKVKNSRLVISQELAKLPKESKMRTLLVKALSART